MIHAQESPDESGEKQAGKTLRIACWSSWDKDDLYIKGKKKGAEEEMVKLKIFNMSYSKEYHYRVGESLKFYVKTGNEENPYKLMLSANIPSSFREPLVLLSITGQGVEHMIYELDDKSFPFGSYKIVNFTPTNLFVNFDGKKFSLKPKSNFFVNPRKSGEQRAVQCRVGIRYKEDTKLVYSSMLMNNPNKRMLMFFYPTKDEAGRSAIKCRSLVDFSSRKKKS